MPKARRKNYNPKKGTVHKNTASTRPDAIRCDTNVTARQRLASPAGGQTAEAARRTEQPARASNYQTLIMPGMVTVGCLGLAISFSFFTTDPNRFLYGGMAVLMALMWAYSFWLRLRKVLRKQSQQ